MSSVLYLLFLPFILSFPILECKPHKGRDFYIALTHYLE